MTAIAEVADRIRANPVPVLIVDSCNFLDLFRVTLPNEDNEKGRRVELPELAAAQRILEELTLPKPSLQLVVPELIPREVAENTDRIVAPAFRTWLDAHDVNQQWVADAAATIGAAPPPVNPVGPFELSTHFQTFSERLLATATVLDRDLPCLLRAVERVVAKRRPSHRKELKDSMNLEQTLELCRQLAIGDSYEHSLCFVSSNTRDFADKDGSRIHADLKAEFDAVSLKYFTSLRSVRGHLIRRDRGYLNGEVPGLS